MPCRPRSPRCTRSRPTGASTDWEQIAALYAVLARIDSSPVVALNHAVAVSFAIDPESALPLLTALAAKLDGYQPFHAAAADVYRRHGRTAEARAEYERAIELSGTPGERAFLERRAARIT